MKKIFIISLVQLFACLVMTAQETRTKQATDTEFDVMIKENGEEITNVKVVEITPIEIKYKKGNNLDGPTYSIAKSDVFMIKYANGEKEVFELEAKPPVRTQERTAPQTPVQTTPPPVQTQKPGQTQTQPTQTTGVGAPAAGQALTTTRPDANQTAAAQSRSTQGRRIRETQDIKKFQIGLSPALGASIPQYGDYTTGFGIIGKARLRFNMSKYFAWDMLNINLGANVGDFTETYVQVMSGLVWKTSGRTAFFLGGQLGYGTGHGHMYVETNNTFSGFCTEWETGLLFRNAFSISLVINYQMGENWVIDYINYDNVLVGIRAGFYF